MPNMCEMNVPMSNEHIVFAVLEFEIVRKMRACKSTPFVALSLCASIQIAGANCRSFTANNGNTIITYQNGNCTFQKKNEKNNKHVKRKEKKQSCDASHDERIDFI